MSRLVALAVAAFAVAAFAVAAPAGSVGQVPAIADDSDTTLVGRAFRSVQVTEAGFPAPMVPGTTLSVAFIDSSHLGARAGCNSYGATYRFIGSHLAIKDDIETLIACPRDLASQEHWLFGALRANPSIAVSGSSLALGEGDLLVQFVEWESGTPAFDPLSI